jgi:Flp pilus assembly protein CpaB
MSGKRVVWVLLALVLAAGLVAWFGATRLEKNSRPLTELESTSVLSEGVLYEARAGDPGVVIAKDVGSGKELWRAELGSLASKPTVTVTEAIVEVQIAGTPWMTLDRTTGEPVE